MKNMLGLGEFFNSIGNVILTGVIVVVLIVCIVVALKFKEARAILGYFFATVLIVSGVFCGIGCYKEIKSESYINGSINIENKLYSDTFVYGSNDIVFYEKQQENKDTTYYYLKEFVPVENFNGEDKTYNVYLNDYLLDCDIKGGSIFSLFEMNFYGVDGELDHSGTLNLSIQFLSNKTVLKLETVNKTSSEYFSNYFKNKGFFIEVSEILGGN